MLSAFERLEDSNIPNPKFKEFLSILKARDENCEGCESLVSPCCNAVVSTVFGSCPLEVKCSSCNKVFLLKNLL